MEDLTRIMSMSITTETRRNNTIPILRHYYDNLLKYASHEGGLIPHSFDEIINLYKYFFRYATYFAMPVATLSDRMNFDDNIRKEYEKIFMDLTIANVLDSLEYMKELGY